jgi:hypothetical protein
VTELQRHSGAATADPRLATLARTIATAAQQRQAPRLRPIRGHRHPSHRLQFPIAQPEPPAHRTRDLVPWRFSDAGNAARISTDATRRPRNLHIKRHSREFALDLNLVDAQASAFRWTPDPRLRAVLPRNRGPEIGRDHYGYARNRPTNDVRVKS